MSALKGRFSGDQLEMIKGMVGGLAARLESDPNDYDGWMKLGRAYVVLENITGAKMAYKKAIGLKSRELEPKRLLADLMTRETNLDARLPEELVRLASDIRALDARQPDALYILGLAKAQQGDSKAARTYWQNALKELTPESALHREITGRLAALP